MGAWDATSFGNDTACDWLADFTESDDFSAVEAALQAVLDTGGEYLDSDEAVQGIAAAEVVAWLRGRPTTIDAYTEKLTTSSRRQLSRRKRCPRSTALSSRRPNCPIFGRVIPSGRLPCPIFALVFRARHAIYSSVA